MSSLYQPLNTAIDEFRLLTICAGLPQSAIICKLDTIPFGNHSRHPEGVYSWTDGKNLDAQWQPQASEAARVRWVPEYEALSYTWGDARVTEPIAVNGISMQVTVNLHEALKALRRSDVDRVVWVDALCINQQDITERSAQVKRMRAIYQRARQTILWLGKSDDDTDRAMHLLEKLGGTQKQIDSFGWPEPLFGWQGPCFDPAYAVADQEPVFYGHLKDFLRNITKFGLVDLSDQDWKALEKFFRNKYWTRIWVVQEISNSQNVEVRCGSRLMAFDTLRYVPFFEKGDIRKYSPKDTDNHERMRTMMSRAYQIIAQRGLTRHPMRTMGMENLGTSFLTIVEEYRSYDCTDPRDKVYALLGLVSIDRDMPLPEPDYSKPVSQVYSETVRAIITHTADLSVLCLPNSFGGMIEHCLPSWVPDWTVKPSGSALVSTSYQATGNTLPRGPEIVLNKKTKDDLRRRINARGMMQMAKGSLESDGMTLRSSYHMNASHNFGIVQLDGFVVDSITLYGDSIADHLFDEAGGKWKTSVIGWEKLLKVFRLFARRGDQVREVHPGFRHPKMPDFMLTLFSGILAAHDEISYLGDTDDLTSVYLEHYHVWAGHLSDDETRFPISQAVLYIMFDNYLRDNLKGRKFATTDKGRLALIPASAQRDDAIVMLFGADVPVVLRPIYRIKKSDGSREVRWIQIGTAYVHGIMAGEALDILKEKKLKVQTFSLM